MGRRTIDWKELPHDRFVGHGREGLILRLGKNRAIKVYTPDKMDSAQREFVNYRFLEKKGFLVPKAEEVVDIHIGGQEVKLPGKCEFQGIGLYNFSGVESVPGVIKEFFPGKVYGKKEPGIKEIIGLLNYLDKLEEEGLTFTDGVIFDFIASQKGTALVDCSTLVKKRELDERDLLGFSQRSKRYKERILSAFESELAVRGFMGFGLELKLHIARHIHKRSE